VKFTPDGTHVVLGACSGRSSAARLHRDAALRESGGIGVVTLLE